GYIDGKNVRFEPRFAAGQVELLDGFVADLLTRRVDIIVATGLREAAAAKRATSSVPIVTIVHPDPLAAGLAQSISRPGSNVTGLATMEVQTGVFGKRVELLHEAVPVLRTCLVLVSEANPIYGPGTPWANDLAALGRKLGIDLVVGPITADNVADVI